MAAPRKEKGYEKYAWLIFLFMGLVEFIPAFFNLEEVSLPERLAALVFAVLTTSLSVTGYRRGRKWAWFALLYTPPYFLVEAYLLNVPPYFDWGLAAFFALLSVVGLILPYRKFFPKKQPVTP